MPIKGTGNHRKPWECCHRTPLRTLWRLKLPMCKHVNMSTYLPFPYPSKFFWFTTVPISNLSSSITEVTLQLALAKAPCCWFRSRAAHCSSPILLGKINRNPCFASNVCCFDMFWCNFKTKAKGFPEFFLKNSRNIGTDWIHGTIWFTCIHKAIWVVNAGKIKQVFRRSLMYNIYGVFQKKWGVLPQSSKKIDGFSMIFQASICGYPQVGGFYVRFKRA